MSALCAVLKPTTTSLLHTTLASTHPDNYRTTNLSIYLSIYPVSERGRAQRPSYNQTERLSERKREREREGEKERESVYLKSFHFFQLKLATLLSLLLR